MLGNNMIYDPVQSGAGIFSGGEIGKNAPFYSPIKAYNVKLVGPGGGRVKAIIAGGRYVYNYFGKYPKFAGSVTGITAGGIIYNASKSSRGKTLQSKVPIYGSGKRYTKQRGAHCCCCTKRRSAGKRRMYY